jgi:hypothetical protein
MDSNGKGTAEERARRVWWSDTAREARREMRRRGLMAGPWIDDVAGQRRGRNVASQMGRLVDEMRRAGVDNATVRAVILGGVDQLLGQGPSAA